MARARLPQLHSITDGSFEPNRKNPISLRDDEHLDEHFKPIKIGGKNSAIELSDDSMRVSGNLIADRMVGDININDGNINIDEGFKLRFDSESAHEGLISGNSYIYVEDDTMYFYVGGEKVLTIAQASGFGSDEKITMFTSDLAIDENQKLYFEGMDSDSYLHRTTGDIYEFYGDNTKLLSINDDGKVTIEAGHLYFENGEYIRNNIDGVLSFWTDGIADDGGLHFESSITGIALNSGDRIIFDRIGGHTYIREESDDQLLFVVGGVEMFKLVSAVANIITMPAGTKLYFDGGSETFIAETSADVLNLVSGGDYMLTLDEASDTITMAATNWVAGTVSGITVTEFSAANSAYAGMILGYACVGADVADDSYTLTTSFVCFDDSGGTPIRVSFNTPPSEYVEIEVELYFSAGSSNKQLRLSLSNNATYGSNSLSHPAQFEKVVSTPARGNGGTVTQKWLMDDGNLSAIGSINHIYIAASTDSTTGTPIIKWGGDATGEYTNLVFKATALPASIQVGS